MDDKLKQTEKVLQWILVWIHLSACIYFFGRLITHSVNDNIGMVALNAALMAGYALATVFWTRGLWKDKHGKGGD